MTVSYDLAACRGFFGNDADELPLPCTLPDFRQADIVIGLKEAEHQSMVERRFPGHRGDAGQPPLDGESSRSTFIVARM
ncbi:hypothetical protein BST63_02085 [Bradyrhizobium canariense]|uniref:Uncharacterized protein n=1 Tax=Bradyrhizobium canariense TaxID=255045 RepID=A0ABX3XC06_9BRAD|nr:hypothetical protein BSR47_02310 [Bradyrhizobium canariense]OSJ35360.1 hypothetical protein BST63_02085 [Bradyrhizobium canariense]